MTIEDKIKKIRETCEKENFPIIQNETADLLKLCLKLKQPKSVLEIGTAIGYSGSLILNECGCFLTTVEIKEDSVTRAKENFRALGFLDRVKIFCGDACEIVPNLTGKYDFIFLDGPKGQYANFLPYLINCLNFNGVLFCDNTSYHGIVKDGIIPIRRDRTIMNNMRKFERDIKSNPNLKTTEFNIGDGIIVSVKNANKI